MPMGVRLAAIITGANASDFAIGWANGLVRWQGRRLVDGMIMPIANTLEPGSVKYAASEAAVRFMKELSE